MDLLQTDAFLSPVIISIKVGIAATIISCITSLFLVFLTTHYRFPGKSVIDTLIMLPMVLPPTVVGFILLFSFGRHGFIGQFISRLFNTTLLFTIQAAVIASSLVAVPLMYQAIKIGVEQIDDDIIEAARIDGAGSWTIFRTIVLPLSKNALLTGTLLAFARAIGEFGATLIFAGNIPGVTQTMPTAIYIAIENDDYVTAGLWAGLMILFSFILMLMIQSIRRKG